MVRATCTTRVSIRAHLVLVLKSDGRQLDIPISTPFRVRVEVGVRNMIRVRNRFRVRIELGLRVRYVDNSILKRRVRAKV